MNHTIILQSFGRIVGLTGLVLALEADKPEIKDAAVQDSAAFDDNAAVDDTSAVDDSATVEESAAVEDSAAV